MMKLYPTQVVHACFGFVVKSFLTRWQKPTILLEYYETYSLALIDHYFSQKLKSVKNAYLENEK